MRAPLSACRFFARLLPPLLAALLLGGCGAGVPAALRPDAAEVAHARLVLHQHGCNSCHVIPGVTGSDVHVGPPLAGMARRRSIAGELPNTQDNMVRWLLDPQAVDPDTAMLAMGLSERDARAVAAYLATLH